MGPNHNRPQRIVLLVKEQAVYEVKIITYEEHIYTIRRKMVKADLQAQESTGQRHPEKGKE